MTRILFVKQSGEVELSVDTDEAIPMTGDLFVNPEQEVFRIVQRAFVTTVQSPIGLVDLSAQKSLTVTIECAIMPIEAEIPAGGIKQ